MRVLWKACASDVFACLCAIMSHSFHRDGLLLPMVLTSMQSCDMDPSVRKQCYGLIKIIIEKWPPDCFRSVDGLCQVATPLDPQRAEGSPSIDRDRPEATE